MMGFLQGEARILTKGKSETWMRFQRNNGFALLNNFIHPGAHTGAEQAPS
jgi:hypothetical protein